MASASKRPWALHHQECYRCDGAPAHRPHCGRELLLRFRQRCHSRAPGRIMSGPCALICGASSAFECLRWLLEEESGACLLPFVGASAGTAVAGSLCSPPRSSCCFGCRL